MDERFRRAGAILGRAESELRSLRDVHGRQDGHPGRHLVERLERRLRDDRPTQAEARSLGETPPEATRVDVGLLAAERDPALLFELARSRLERVQVGRAVVALRLLAESLPPFVPASRDLFDARPQQAQDWPQLRERLRARLGDGAVYQYDRYTVQINGHQSYLFFERSPNISGTNLGKWFVERK